MSKPNHHPKFPPLLFVLFAVLLWSTAGLFIKMTSLDAFTINFGRSLLAAITVGLLTIRKGFKLTGFTLFSALLYAGILTCFVSATKMTTAANAIFLQYTAPIYILILSPLLLKERFRVVDLLAVVCCLAGMSLFFLDTPKEGNQLATNPFLGNLVALLSGALFGLYIVLLRHPKALSHGNPSISVFYGNLVVMLLMLPLLIANPPQPTTKDLFILLYLGIFQLGISYLLFTYGIVHGVRSFDASIIGFVEPLLNPLWVFLAVKEAPSPWALIGGTVIIITIAAHTIFTNRNRVRAAEAQYRKRVAVER